MIARLMARVFATRNAAHNAHLRTRSCQTKRPAALSMPR